MPDTVMVELPREVARAFVKHERGVTPEQSRRERTPFWIDEWTAVVKVDPRVPEACREALTNPTRSDESELRLAAEEVVGFAGIMTALTPEKERREIPTTFNTMLGTFGELLDNLAATLSQTPEAEQKEIPDERICPGCKGTGVRDANHGMCRACNGYGKFQDPPPTATGEGSQSVSEGAGNSRGGDKRFTTGTLSGDLRELAKLIRDQTEQDWIGVTESNSVNETLESAQAWRHNCRVYAEGVEQAAGYIEDDGLAEAGRSVIADRLAEQLANGVPPEEIEWPEAWANLAREIKKYGGGSRD